MIPTELCTSKPFVGCHVNLISRELSGALDFYEDKIEFNFFFFFNIQINRVVNLLRKYVIILLELLYTLKDAKQMPTKKFLLRSVIGI